MKKSVRDVILLLAGLAGTWHETFIQKGERPSLLTLFAAMMISPAFMRTEEWFRKKPREDDEMRRSKAAHPTARGKGRRK